MEWNKYTTKDFSETMNSYKRKWWEEGAEGNQEVWSSREVEELKTVSRGGKESQSFCGWSPGH